ncbi:methylated-DNA--[protein]-cysteine S-methyltransferase [Actinomadura decatromicini]|uniref:Methylated-DNA--protein-cysteine methyltransferase n=1 Tax=Actinomadura decatromicini TaxID=2604572 RepID=A0A5D3FS24_9ACTN|nr:methylated-DNA--[protein]-cysteine S-methyltransferase [Actinomadura decatromicini]TYK50696.1 methylated-DNA--[protein]-cysteine S-methyltransferase [Actinomadura decatromicini]
MGSTRVVLDSPVGDLTLVAVDGGLAGLYMEVQRHRPSDEMLGIPGDPKDEPFASAAEQLSAYFAGDLTEFDLPLNLLGTPFQQQVWTALQEIPYGETTTYGQIAVDLGKPSASRAVGLANGRNPISLIVPCHRVVGANGALTGYGGGLDRKRYLLDFERKTRSTADALF